MSALDQFAADIGDTLAEINSRFADLNAQRQRVKTMGEDIAFRWAAHLSEQSKALQAAEDALNRISNAPAPPKPAVTALEKPKLVTSDASDPPHVSNMTGSLGAGRSNPV